MGRLVVQAADEKAADLGTPANSDVNEPSAAIGGGLLTENSCQTDCSHVGPLSVKIASVPASDGPYDASCVLKICMKIYQMNLVHRDQ
jgi:hypothetical protein